MDNEILKHQTINDFINKSLKNLSKPSPPETEIKSSIYDKYKINLKKKKLKTALKKTTIRKKYSRFFGDGETKYRPVDATGFDSSLSSDVGISDGGGEGWGAGDGWGVTAFGEGISQTASLFIDFVRDIKNTESDEVINTIMDGYKTVFHNVETNSSAILCGIQPSMKEYFNFDMSEFVFAVNNFGGSIVSIVLGESTLHEPIEITKQWYAELGIHQDIIEEITFIEKCNIEFSDYSAIDISVTNNQSNSINSSTDLNELCQDLYNPILIGCTDIFFMGEFMLQFAKLERYVQIDKKFIYILGVE